MSDHAHPMIALVNCAGQEFCAAVRGHRLRRVIAMNNNQSEAKSMVRSSKGASQKSRLHESEGKIPFGLLASGFITTSSGRVYLPLIGRAKLVPSVEAEEAFGARRRKWPVVVAGIALFLAIIWVLNSYSLSSMASTAVIFSGPLVILAFAYWRNRALMKTWANVDDTSRKDLVVEALTPFSAGRLIAPLVGEMLFWGFVAYVLISELPAWFSTHNVSDLDFSAWGVGLLIFGLYVHHWYFVLAALIRRRRRPAALSAQAPLGKQ